MNEKSVASHERMRLPEITTRASDFVSYIEAATPDNPARLEVITGNEADLIKLLYAELEMADKLYAQHDELFSNRNTTRSYEEILELTKAIQANLLDPSFRIFSRAAHLGVGVMQFAEAGARLAANPHTVSIHMHDANHIEQQIISEGASFATSAFAATIGPRIHGNMQKIPEARRHYPGFLLDIHLAFWKLEHVHQTESTLHEQIQKIFLRSSAKALRFDAHSFYGRPDRSRTRAAYLEHIKSFQETLQTGESAGVNVPDAIEVVLPSIFESLDVAYRDGYSPDDCLKIAILNSSVIGKLSERTRSSQPLAGKGMFRLEHGPEGPRLVIGFPESSHTHNTAFSQATKTKLKRREEQGGTCPLRNPVRLNRDGEVHKNIQALANACADRIGAAPPLLNETGGNIYVNSAALTVTYLLLIIADNYHS